MSSKWGGCLVVIGLLALLAGCRSTTPDLKPAKEPEKLQLPSDEARFNSSDYPKQAFARDKSKQYDIDDKLPDSLTNPGGAGSKGIGGGGMGGR
jgi:hypothetical protein